MDHQGTLPPMPGSDVASLSNNYYDKFYNRSSRDVWRDAKITYVRDEPIEKCKHYFMAVNTDFICKHCKFGLSGGRGLNVQDGKLLVGSEIIPISG